MKRILTSALAGLLLAAGTASAAPSKSTPVSSPAPALYQASKRALSPAQKRARVRAFLAQRRDLNAQRLHQYSQAGHFPKNNVRPGMLNLFIGDDGAICAAANLMFLDGHEQLVRKTAKEDNYLRLVTVKSGPLYDWILTSGMTQTEIDDIQEPYMGDMDEPSPEPRKRRIAREVQRLRTHFAGVQQRLSKNQKASLDAATDLVMARPDLVSTIIDG